MKKPAKAIIALSIIAPQKNFTGVEQATPTCNWRRTKPGGISNPGNATLARTLIFSIDLKRAYERFPEEKHKPSTLFDPSIPRPFALFSLLSPPTFQVVAQTKPLTFSLPGSAISDASGSERTSIIQLSTGACPLPLAPLIQRIEKALRQPPSSRAAIRKLERRRAGARYQRSSTVAIG